MLFSLIIRRTCARNNATETSSYYSDLTRLNEHNSRYRVSSRTDRLEMMSSRERSGVDIVTLIHIRARVRTCGTGIGISLLPVSRDTALFCFCDGSSRVLANGIANLFDVHRLTGDHQLRKRRRIYEGRNRENRRVLPARDKIIVGRQRTIGRRADQQAGQRYASDQII
jgi:hypothetical protein